MKKFLVISFILIFVQTNAQIVTIERMSNDTIKIDTTKKKPKILYNQFRDFIEWRRKYKTSK